MKKILKKYWLYFALLVVTAIVRISPASIGTHWDEAINDIAIGMFASVMVALFIQIKDDCSAERKNKIIANRLFYPLLKSVFEYMDLFPFASCYHDLQKRNEIKTFPEWNEYYLQRTKEDSEFEGISKEDLTSYIDKVKKQADELLSNQAWYLAEGVFSVADIEFVKAISTIFSTFNLFLITSNYHNGIKQQNDNLIEALSKRPELSKIKTVAHGYDYRLVKYLDDNIWKQEI